jgi:hypothetical protein
MKKMMMILGLVMALALPVEAATISTTTTTITVGGDSVTANVSPARTPGYYRLVYDVSTKKIKTLVFSIGITETINGLFCADTYAEVQAYATANSLTGLPKDPQLTP